MEKNAVLSPCQKYRYTLSRVWDKELEIIMFIGLNPSTADADIDDHTTRRLNEFTRAWGYGGYYLCNLYAFRATEPADLFMETFPVSDPLDPEKNNNSILNTSRLASKIIFCWGNNGAADQRYYQVQKLFPEAMCFGTTMSGQPKHPLYLPKEAELIKYDNDKPYINPKIN